MTLDLVLVVADKGLEQAFLGLLARPEALGIRPLRFAIRVHHYDSSCYLTGHEIAATSAGEATHALVVFDAAWDGAPSQDPADLESVVEARLKPVWGARGRCVVIAPELEAWVWSDSPHVAAALGWKDGYSALRDWLEREGLWPVGLDKPPDPKAAYERALRHAKLPPSNAIFRRLASRVSTQRCRDRAFERIQSLLRGWFASAAPVAP
jgi:hypothetical protein